MHYLVTAINFYAGLYTNNFKRANSLAQTLTSAGGSKLFPELLIEEYKVKSSQGHEIPIEIQVPKNYDSSKPVILQIHGGGFVILGSTFYSAALARNGSLVISIYYRLAPEHPFPAATDDCLEVFKWIHKKEHKLLKDIDLSKIVVVGDSAGGNLAAVLSYRVRDDESIKQKILKQILVYPVIQMNHGDTKSRKEHQNAYLLSTAKMNWFLDMYHPDGKVIDEHPHANVMKAKSHKNLPCTMIILARFDPLYSEGKDYGETLKKNSVNVEMKEYPMMHGVYGLEFISEGKASLQDSINFIQQ